MNEQLLLKNKVNIDFSRKYQTWWQIYHLGSKNTKSGIQTIIDSTSAEWDANNSSQIAHKYNFEEFDPNFLRLAPKNQETIL